MRTTAAQEMVIELRRTPGFRVFVFTGSDEEDKRHKQALKMLSKLSDIDGKIDKSKKNVEEAQRYIDRSVKYQEDLCRKRDEISIILTDWGY